jgi:hypothetical protein
MRYPPRLAHLATKGIVAAKLAPTYAESHHVDDDEAQIRFSRAIQGPLLDEILAATWTALLNGTRKLDEAGLLEKVAKSIAKHPYRHGKPILELSNGWGAFLVLIDVNAGLASDAARNVLETPEGQKRVAAGILEVGQALAAELLRK